MALNAFSAGSTHLNIYHQKYSLLFQFILAEFIESYTEVLHIHRFSETESSQITKEALSKLSTSIRKLSGSQTDYMSLFNYRNEESILARLKNYCAFFSQHTEHQSKESIEMHKFINRAWLACIQSLDMIYLLDESAAKTYQKTLRKALLKIVTLMQRFSRVLIKVLMQFKADENVVFYLIRHHVVFDDLFGSQFVYKLLHRMYPKGLGGVASFLKKNYGVRGFEHLFPLIDTKLAELAGVNTWEYR